MATTHPDTLTTENTVTPEMLPGVRHYETSGFASTWEAYDRLIESDGWTEHAAELARWKRNTIDGRNLVVHAPHFDRPDYNERENTRARRMLTFVRACKECGNPIYEDPGHCVQCAWDGSR